MSDLGDRLEAELGAAEGRAAALREALEALEQAEQRAAALLITERALEPPQEPQDGRRGG